MNKKPEFTLTEGSEYKIYSVGGKDEAFETRGIFKGFVSIGIEDTGLLIELGEFHGDMKGKLRIIPFHAVLAIDVIEAKQNKEKEDDGDTSHYVG